MGTTNGTLIVAVLNQKGGVGKTTLATNLAAAAHLEGRSTMLLDLDSQGSAMDWYLARAKGSRLDGLVVAGVDKPLAPEKFAELTRGYDVAFLDGPARLGVLTRAAAVAADVVLVPLKDGPFDMWAGEETLALLDEADSIRAQLRRPPARRVFVINEAAQGTVAEREAREGLEGAIVAPTVVKRAVFKRAAKVGESALTRESEGRAAAEILAVWQVLNAQVTKKGRGARPRSGGARG